MLKLSGFILWLFVPFISVAQNNPILTNSSKEDIVKSISQLLIDDYVYPDTAIKMSECINNKFKYGGYNPITDPVAFSDTLTKDIFSIYHDGHLLIQYNPKLESALLDSSKVNGNSNINYVDRNREANFGFKRVEILNGNIGYINLTNFWVDEIYGKETMNAAFKFVANTKALIIDLRTNGGGSPKAVSMICSYFFPSSVHINDTYNRVTNSTIEYWTNPDSSLTEFNTKPLYILTSNKTFSAAEEFAYDLQSLHRATIIGETTGGGAHNTFEQPVGHGFVLYVPYGRAINPITKTNWEKIGVKPTVEVASDKGLDVAEMKIFEMLLNSAKDSTELYSLNWQKELLKAINNPFELDLQTLKSFAGVYEERTFTVENGKLYYQRTGKPKFELEAMSQNMMKGKGNNYFKIEFIKNDKGIFNRVKVYYQDNRMEESKRNQ